MIVLVPRFGIEGIVQIESKVDEGPRRFSYDERRETLTSLTDPACVLRTFDKVRARLRKASLSRPSSHLPHLPIWQVRVRIWVDAKRAHRPLLQLAITEPKMPEASTA